MATCGIKFISLRSALLTIALAAILPIVWLQPMFLLRFLARTNPDVLYFAPVTEKAVALTIDDSPHSQVTPQLLDVLKENGARATFFIIGDHIPGNTHILERARREGHELGNHLVHEFPTIFLPISSLKKELEEVDQFIGPAGTIKWFRPGSGWYSRRIVEQVKKQGYRCALGSVYPFDNLIRSSGMISMHIKSQIFPGAVIIIHDGKLERVRSVEVLKEVLPDLKRRGYRVVTLTKLVEIADREQKRTL